MNKKILIVLIALTAVALIAFIIVNQKFPQKPEITKQELQQEFQLLKSRYEQAKTNGYDVSEAEKLAREAKKAFDKGNYAVAKEYLEYAFISLRQTRPSNRALPKQNNSSIPGNNSLSDVKVAIVYERLNDARPKRTIDEQLQILKDTKADLIFRASWRWNPLPNSCSKEDLEKLPGYNGKVTQKVNDECVNSGYSFESMKGVIDQIKKQNQNIIIVGAIPAQKINKLEFNEVTSETFDETQTWEMALDPAKWGIKSITKEEMQEGLKFFSETGYYPDITNPEYQDLLLSWAKRQIDGGMDGIWIDLLYTQASKLAQITKDANHPAVKESYEAASKIVDEIHKYGESKEKYIYVGTWSGPAMNFPYTKPRLDFVTETPMHNEIRNKKIGEGWVKRVQDINSVFKDIPVFAFVDWAGDKGQLALFSQMSKSDQSEFLIVADESFTNIGIKFIYPVHGGNAHSSVLVWGEYSKWYDSLAPEFQTYNTIKQLAQNKSNKK